MAIFQPRRKAYSRIARFCIGRVRWSCVETRAYKPARNILAELRLWPKTLADFTFPEARFAAIPGYYLILAAKDGFWPAPSRREPPRIRPQPSGVAAVRRAGSWDV